MRATRTIIPLAAGLLAVGYWLLRAPPKYVAPIPPSGQRAADSSSLQNDRASIIRVSFRSLRSLADINARVAAMRDLVARLSPEEFAQLADLIRAEKIDDLWLHELEVFCEAWASHEPRAAMAFATEVYRREPWLAPLARTVFKIWTDANTPGAMAYLEALDSADSHWKREAMAGFAASLTPRDPAAARLWAEQPGDLRWAAMGRVTDNTPDREIAATAAWLAQKQDPDDDFIYESVALLAPRFAQASPANALDWAVSLKPGDVREEALHQVIYHVGINHPDALVALINRPDVTTYLFGAGAGRLAPEQLSAKYDKVLNEVFQGFLATNRPEWVVANIDLIEDNALRTRLAEAIAAAKAN